MNEGRLAFIRNFDLRLKQSSIHYLGSVAHDLEARELFLTQAFEFFHNLAEHEVFITTLLARSELNRWCTEEWLIVVHFFGHCSVYN